jgi:hypothetical protein
MSKAYQLYDWEPTFSSHLQGAFGAGSKYYAALGIATAFCRRDVSIFGSAGAKTRKTLTPQEPLH